MNRTTHHCEWNCPVSDVLEKAEAVPGYSPDISIADVLLVDTIVGAKCIKHINPDAEKGISHHLHSLDLSKL